MRGRVWSDGKRGPKLNKNYLPFQRAIILLCNTIPEMFDHFQTEYGITSMKMKRFNQDCLENHFSQIRGWGHEHPGPVEILKRERCVGLGAKAKTIQNAAVRLEEEGGSFNLSAGALTAEILNSIELVCD